MTREEIFDAVVTAVTQIQEQSQRDLPSLRGDTRLIGDVPGCDSLVVVEVSIILTEILAPILHGREIPDCILQGAGKNDRPTLNDIAGSVETFIREGKAPRVSKSTKGHSEGRPVVTNGDSGHGEKASKALLASRKPTPAKPSS